MVSETSSHSLGWRGKDADEDLQVLTAQVRKFRVRTFIWEVVKVVTSDTVCCVGLAQVNVFVRCSQENCSLVGSTD